MSFSIGRFNKGSQFTYKLPEDSEFKKLSELLPDSSYRVRGLYISSKGKFGDHPVAVGDSFYIDLPKHLVGVVKEMIADPEVVEAINAGVVGLKAEAYHSKQFDKDCFGVEWVDIEPDK